VELHVWLPVLPSAHWQADVCAAVHVPRVMPGVPPPAHPTQTVTATMRHTNRGLIVHPPHARGTVAHDSSLGSWHVHFFQHAGALFRPQGNRGCVPGLLDADGHVTLGRMLTSTAPLATHAHGRRVLPTWLALALSLGAGSAFGAVVFERVHQAAVTRSTAK